MKKISFKTLLPHLVALSVFLIITIMFFYPVIFQGKVMTQNDIVQGVSSAQEISEYRTETGEEALWTNSMFSGMPAYLINVYWSGDLTIHLQNFISLYLPSPARYTFLAMLCFYILLLSYKVNPYVAIAGSVAYGLNSFFIVSIEAGHIWKVAAIAYMPLVLAGIRLILKEKIIPGIAITSAAVALLIRSNHVQIAYYLFFVLVVFWIVYLIDAIKQKNIASYARITAFIAIGGLLGISANIGKLWTAAEYSPYTIRGKSELKANTQSTSGGLDRDYAFAWSNGVSESFTFMVPYFYGGATTENVGTKSKLAKELRKSGISNAQIRQISTQIPTYWGKQPYTSGPIYAGIITVFLFVLGIFTLKGPIRVWLISATILGFMLSWGKNFSSFNYLMFDYFPLYNKFRAVSMALVIPLLCMPLLGFLGLSEFLKSPNKKVLIKSLGIVGGLLVLFLISSSFMGFKAPNDSAIGQQIFLDAIISQRKSMFQVSTMRSVFFLIVFAGILYYFIRKNSMQTLVLGSTIVLVFLDLYFIDRNYIDQGKFSAKNRIAAYQPDEADARIIKDEGHYRVLNLTVPPFENATTSYYHSSVGGYHGAKIRRYADVISYHLNNEIQQSISQIQAGSFQIEGIPVLNMLNTKYLKLSTTANAVLQNSGTMGNAWFVKEIKRVDDADQAISMIGTTNLHTTAVSERLSNKDGLSVGSITLNEYKPNYLKYQTNNPGEGFAVFSEVYYPKGWKAWIDGTEAEIHQVNYLLRGVDIPAGSHTIEFRFEPNSYFVGNNIMMIGSILVIGMLLFSVVTELRKANA